MFIYVYIYENITSTHLSGVIFGSCFPSFPNLFFPAPFAPPAFPSPWPCAPFPGFPEGFRARESSSPSDASVLLPWRIIRQRRKSSSS